MNPRKILKILTGPVLLLLLIYLVWFVRYPMWQIFTFVEPIFLVLILSYSVVLLLSLAFLKKDTKTSLHSIFKAHGYVMPLVGMGFAVLFQIIWFSIALLAGGRFETSSFPALRGYEAYLYYALVPAFGLYFAFAVFGAFAEEVAFRRYIQSKLARNFGVVLAILIASLFFSLEHIQIVNLAWISDFFQTQFIYVFFFGIFVGYFFL
jgi:membrane protease YdiL (CAAX protease family)